MSLICKICGREWKNYISLGTHVVVKHKVSRKGYYDKFLKKENEGVCRNPGCLYITTFVDLNLGYLLHCSPKCGTLDPNVKFKSKETCLKNHGVDHSSKSERVKQKNKQTMLYRYGVEYPFQMKEWIDYMKNGGAIKALKGVKNPSKAELQLREIVKEVCEIFYLYCENQYKILNYAVDIGIPDYKIAIEYDGYYHFNCQESIDYHNKRQKEIEALGWKFIRYEKVSSKEQVKEDINRLIREIKAIIK